MTQNPATENPNAEPAVDEAAAQSPEEIIQANFARIEAERDDLKDKLLRRK